MVVLLPFRCPWFCGRVCCDSTCLVEVGGAIAWPSMGVGACWSRHVACLHKAPTPLVAFGLCLRISCLVERGWPLVGPPGSGRSHGFLQNNCMQDDLSRQPSQDGDGSVCGWT